MNGIAGSFREACQSSINRAVRPEIVFIKSHGAYLWDAEGNRYVDYHAAFAPYMLGHNDPEVTEAVIEVQRGGASLYGSGASELEGELAELVCSHVPAAEAVQILNTGSEATAQAIRLARAAMGSRIRVNAVCPGTVDTPMLSWASSLDEDPTAVFRACAEMHVLGRIAKPGEIAEVIAFLAHDRASFVTGAVWTVDGGLLTRIGGAPRIANNS